VREEKKRKKKKKDERQLEMKMWYTKGFFFFPFYMLKWGRAGGVGQVPVGKKNFYTNIPPL
jgi:hypothetical protein